MSHLHAGNSGKEQNDDRRDARNNPCATGVNYRPAPLIFLLTDVAVPSRVGHLIFHIGGHISTVLLMALPTSLDRGHLSSVARTASYGGARDIPLGQKST
jgi:hypothetical protein